MEIAGYYIREGKEYVAFKENRKNRIAFKITDGFHDRPVSEKNVGKYQEYRRVGKDDIDLEKIISRMRGTRPWHPLLKLMKREGMA